MSLVIESPSMVAPPVIRRISRLIGKTLTFRAIEVDDAGFVVSLRADPDKSRHLSAVSGSVAEQRAWIKAFGQRSGEAYFVIETAGRAIGTVRLYDAIGTSFCWGSWVLADGAPTSAALESALMVYAYAIDHLGFEQAHFQVRVGNERVWAFHERFGAQRVSVVDGEFHYRLSGDAIRASRERYRRYLPGGVEVYA